MRKNNWIVAAIAAVACGVLLWAWFALGFNHVDDPLDLVVAVVWWLAVAAVVGGIVWAEGKRREKMRLAFIGEGIVYNPEAGLVMPDAGESELAALERHVKILLIAILDRERRTSNAISDETDERNKRDDRPNWPVRSAISCVLDHIDDGKNVEDTNDHTSDRNNRLNS